MRIKLTLLLILTMMFVSNKTNAQQNVVTTNDSINQFKKDSIVKFKFGGSNYSVSKYIPRSGTQVGQGIANQTLAFISYSNLSTYFWLNYGFRTPWFVAHEPNTNSNIPYLGSWPTKHNPHTCAPTSAAANGLLRQFGL